MIRLSKANSYHDVDYSEGTGDRRECEIRTPADPCIDVSGIRAALGQIEGVEKSEEQIVREIYQQLDDPNIEYISKGDGRFVAKANSKVDSVVTNGVEETSPYVLCMSREPDTKLEWGALRESLPNKYDTWTVKEDISRLTFEIECGLKRWLAPDVVYEHHIKAVKVWVTNEYHEAPTGSWENNGQLG